MAIRLRDGGGLSVCAFDQRISGEVRIAGMQAKGSGSAKLSKIITPGDHDEKNPVALYMTHSPSARGRVGNTR